MIIAAAEAWREVREFLSDPLRESAEMDFPSGFFFHLRKFAGGMMEIRSAGYDGLEPSGEAENYLYWTISDYCASGILSGPFHDGAGQDGDPDSGEGEQLTLAPGFRLPSLRRYVVQAASSDGTEFSVGSFATVPEAKEAAKKSLLCGAETAGIYDTRKSWPLYVYNYNFLHPLFSIQDLARHSPRYLTAPTDTASRDQIAMAI